MIRAVPYTNLWPNIFLFAICLPFLWITGFQFYQNDLFAHHGLPSTATLESKYTYISQGKHSHTVYHLHYRYPAGAVIVENGSSVCRKTYDSISTGQTLPLLYLDNKINSTRVELPTERASRRSALRVTLGITGFAVALCSGLLIFIVHRNRRYRLLLERGTPCPGTVTSIESKVVGKNRTLRFYLVFTFRDPQGQEITGRSDYLKPAHVNAWKTGAGIRVCVNPRNSKVFAVDTHPAHQGESHQ